MKIIIALALTLAALAALHLPILKKKKGIIPALYAIGMILFFCVYNFRTMDKLTTFYHPVNQTVYQMQFLENGEYPDAFLEEFLKGKIVYTPNDAYDVKDNITAEEVEPKEDEQGNYWLYGYYHAVNMWSFLELCNATVVKDDSLNGVRISDPQSEYYEKIGSANDLLRYVFPLSPYNAEFGNAYYHYWYYGSYIGDSRIFICPEDFIDANELILIWQRGAKHDTDSYYLASKKYYDEVISRNE